MALDLLAMHLVLLSREDDGASLRARGTDEAGRLLDRFTAEIRQVVPLVALRAHRSLALGDFQPGRSDFDLVALVSSGVGGAQRQQLEGVHQTIINDVPLAAKLHCSYVPRPELPDAGRRHLTWEGGRLFDRPVPPVSRRELRADGLCLYGPAPAGLVPPVADQELADCIRRDLRDRWRPVTGRPHLWLRDLWVELGLLTLARASVTLDQGRLITKREALDVLAGAGTRRRGRSRSGGGSGGGSTPGRSPEPESTGFLRVSSKGIAYCTCRSMTTPGTRRPLTVIIRPSPARVHDSQS
jgi:hypothetical protein